MGNASILVSGDLVADRHIYAGEGASLAASGLRDTVQVSKIGGAALVQALLQASGGRAALGVVEPDLAKLAQSYTVWAPFPREERAREASWRIRDLLGYGGEGPERLEIAKVEAPDVLVLDDGAYIFREQASCPAWHLPDTEEAGPRWIVLKHCRPVAQGPLWHALERSHAKRLVCLVAADDLRHEGASVSRGLSWDATAVQLLDALRSNPALSRLLACAHLVVRLGCDGALWVDRTSPAALRATLVFDPRRAEGEWEAACPGRMVGVHAAFTAGVVHHLAGQSEGGEGLLQGIKHGLEAVRDLWRNGHGQVGAEKGAGFPTSRLAEVIRKGGSKLAHAAVPWPLKPDAHHAAGRRWSLLEEAHRLPAHADGSVTLHPEPLLGLAMEVARRGPAALDGLPTARFGAFLTADRHEMEALRTLRALMLRHKADPRPARPLNLAVFGPPGAGKSFAVKQVARELFGKDAWLEFNLSQFETPDELAHAFHRVRDLALAGETPVAFWDEFDSQDLRWLRFLLAPMQDGTFSQGQLVHPLGKCVFVFAGGTSSRFRDFAERGAEEKFRASKGPDFVSRLDGHLDVLGPNRRVRRQEDAPDSDVGMPLRRAVLLRGHLGLGDQRLEADDGLLRGLLTVPAFRHGSRSFTKLLERIHQDGALSRSALPPAGQLDMHVDAAAFESRLAPCIGTLDDVAFEGKVERLAEAIHTTYQELMAASGQPVAPEYANPFGGLREEAKDENRAAARRIPGVLALAGLALCESDPLPEDVVAKHLAAQIERLAKAEHDGWVEHRRRHGWKPGDRDAVRKTHPSMKDYGELSEVERQKDRSTVLNYPSFAWKAGLRIGLLK